MGKNNICKEIEIQINNLLPIKYYIKDLNNSIKFITIMNITSVLLSFKTSTIFIK